MSQAALRWLYSFLTPQRGAIVLLALLSLLATGMALLQPWFTKLIIDDGLLAGDFDALLLYAGGLLVLGIASTLLSGYNRLKHTRISGEILFALREDVFSHLQKLPPSFYVKERAGDLVSRLDRDVAEIQRFAVDTLFSAFSAIMGLAGTLTMMLILSWKLSLVLLLLVPIELFYLKFMRPKVERRNRQVRERGADISSFLAEKIPAIKYIQSAGAEDRELGRLHGLNRTFLGDLFNLQLTEFWTGAVPSLLVTASRAGVFILGGYWVIQGEFELGSLIAFGAYLGMASGPVQGLLGLYLAWQRLRVSLERVSYIREQPLPQAVGGRAVPVSLRGALTFDGVHFAHGETRIVSGERIEIAAGSKVGIVGPTGIGKSSLLDLVQGYLVPDTGRILIDGHDIAEFEPAAWRACIAAVPQDPVIFRDTLAGNLRYAVPDVSEAQLDEAISRAHLSQLVQRLPDGVNQLLSERGINISGGEKQRIALARALLQHPALVLMDEPTSAVDAAMEAALITEVDDLFSDATRLFVSHREGVLRDADILIRMQPDGIQVSARERHAC